MEIKPGDEIKWFNEDSAAHTVTSGDLDDADSIGALFDSGLLLAETQFSLRLTRKGVYPYFCLVHPWKIGKIVVK